MSALDALFAAHAAPLRLQGVLLALLLALLLGRLIAFTYQRTYVGLSYTHSFIQTLTLSALVTAGLMLAIGDNLARGLGVLSTVALVRFRTNIREPRDMIFLFAALVTGMAAGVRAHAVAVTSAGVFCLAAAMMAWAPLRHRHGADGVLRFWLPREAADAEALRALLAPRCQRLTLVALRDVAQGEALEYTYQVQLRRGGSPDPLIQGLSALPGIEGLSFLSQADHEVL